ncbi:MAG: hypothetical protein LQ342_000321 [Letrouitia transgressa]|nr:MAG: hypothetical protein LQ342_000321 [Letrouitia transgressa]
MYPPDPIDFPSADLEFAAHRIQLLAPDAPALAALLARAREKRAASRDDDFPEELVARSLRSQALWHVSDGPRGGVWVVEGGREEVVVALVEEMEGLKEGRMRDKGALGREIGVRDVDAGSARWEVLGVGSGGSEGRVFLVHGCGVGPVVVGSEKKGGKGGVRGRAKVISESLRGIFG